MTLCLPRDELSIPVVRRTLGGALKALGVPADEAHDIQVAVTEACTNVLDHVEDGDEYAVTCSVSEDVASIEVVDTGRGFDSESLGLSEADHSAEEGRGLQLIRALVDKVQFTRQDERGSVVRFQKQLHLPETAPAKQLAGIASRKRA
ncbi:MAG: serine/threonine-protein kinase RsbW [Frankiales bacterium]|jgi:serine/threonine-protein kinase RsbW|nr:serine/threonine-protein kinase RsbW [Frankiales bacterium]